MPAVPWHALCSATMLEAAGSVSRVAASQERKPWACWSGCACLCACRCMYLPVLFLQMRECVPLHHLFWCAFGPWRRRGLEGRSVSGHRYVCEFHAYHAQHTCVCASAPLFARDTRMVCVLGGSLCTWSTLQGNGWVLSWPGASYKRAQDRNCSSLSKPRELAADSGSLNKPLSCGCW